MDRLPVSVQLGVCLIALGCLLIHRLKRLRRKARRFTREQQILARSIEFKPRPPLRARKRNPATDKGRAL